MSWLEKWRSEAAKQDGLPAVHSNATAGYLGRFFRKVAGDTPPLGAEATQQSTTPPESSERVETQREKPPPTVTLAVTAPRAIRPVAVDDHADGPWHHTTRSAAALAVAPRPRHRPPAPLSVIQFAVGDVIADLYKVVRIVSRTKKFIVYLAHHAQWDIDVVVKAPHPDLLADTAALQSIPEHAARWTALGFHPHIAYCHHVHSLDELPLIVIEYIDGGNLRPWIASGRTANLRLGLDLAIQICHGLEHAHARGVWHGALIPENLLVTADGTVRISDFSITSGQRPDAFVAPEQWVDTASLDVQTDVFALGVCFYEMFCGGWPYEIARGPRREPPEPRSTPGNRVLPERLAALLKLCVDWDRERRPTTVAHIRRELCAVHLELFDKPSSFAELPAATWEPDGWNNQAVAALQLGRPADADAAWANALAADSGHVVATYNYGVARWRRGDLSDVALLRELERLKGEPTTAYLLGLLHLERGDAAAAVPLLEAAAAKAPAAAEVGGALDVARSQLGNEPSAGRELSGHSQFVSAVAISADGRWAVSAGDDNSLCLWDAVSGRFVRSFDGHGRRVSSVSLTPDAALALSGSDDFTVRLWKVKSGHCLKTITLGGKVFSVSLSTDGCRAVVVSSGKDNFLGIDGTLLQVWDMEKGRCLRTLEGHCNAAKSAVLSADGRLVVSGSDDETVRVWDISSGNCLRVLQGHKHYVSCVSVSADGAHVLSGSWDRTLRLWDAIKGRCLRVFRGHDGIVTSVALGTDGRFAISGGWDATVRIWEVETGRCLRTFEGHTGMVTGVALSNDGGTAISGSWDTTVRLWRVPTATPPVCTLRLSARVPYARLPSLEPEPDELLAQAERAWGERRTREALEHLRKAREDTQIDRDPRAKRLWRSLSDVCRRVGLRGATSFTTLHTPDRVDALQLSSASRRVLTAGRDEVMRVWDPDLERCVHTFEGHSGRVFDLALSADETGAVSASADGTLRVWDLGAGTCVRTLVGHRSLVNAVSISADGRRVLSGSYDHTVRLWDLASGECAQIFKGHTRQVTAACLSPDGQWAVSGGYDQLVRFWQTSTGACTRALEGHTRPITALAVSRDGTAVLSGSADQTLRLWDVATGQCARVIEGHSDVVVSAQLSSDGRWALSASRDGTVRLWDARTGQCVRDIQRSAVAVTAAVFSPDGCWVAVTTADDWLHLWELEWELE